MDIKNPRRIMILGHPNAGILDLVKGDYGSNPQGSDRLTKARAVWLCTDSKFSIISSRLISHTTD
jgi:hypothetical protein